MTHILIVDDDPGVQATLSAFLGAEGFRLSVASDGTATRQVLDRERIDLILLDVRLPGEDGLALTRWLRARTTIPIILISGMGEDVDRIVGLEIGADDYVVKPFNLRELLARIRAVLRRAATVHPAEAGRMREFAGWTLDLARRQLRSPEGMDVPLTRGEFDMLEALSRRPGRALTRDQILDLLPNPDNAPTDRTVDVMILRLRKKIEPDPEVPHIIVTVYGVGYLFAPEVHET